MGAERGRLDKVSCCGRGGSTASSPGGVRLGGSWEWPLDPMKLKEPPEPSLLPPEGSVGVVRGRQEEGTGKR